MCQGLDGLEGEKERWRMGRGDMLETGCLKVVENNALNGDERILEHSHCLASLSLHGVNKAIV